MEVGLEFVKVGCDRAILMLHNCEGQSHKRVSTDHNLLKRKESRSGFELRSLCLQALPLGQTGSLCACDEAAGSPNVPTKNAVLQPDDNSPTPQRTAIVTHTSPFTVFRTSCTT